MHFQVCGEYMYVCHKDCKRCTYCTVSLFYYQRILASKSSKTFLKLVTTLLLFFFNAGQKVQEKQG